MVTKTFAKLAILVGFVIASASFSAQAERPYLSDQVVDPHDDLASCMTCATGINKIGGTILRLPGAADFRDLVQNVNRFNPSGEDPLKTPEQLGLSPKHYNPIGYVRNNQDIPHPKTGKIIKKGEARASTWFVSPCYAFTNYHAVFGGAKNPRTGKYSATVFIGEDLDTHKPYEIEGKPIRYGNYFVNQDPGEDWVLLKVTTPEGKCPGTSPRIGWMEMGQVDQRDLDVPVSIMGFYDAKVNQQPFGEKNCLIRHFNSEEHWAHDCAVLPGSSGSPLFKIVNGIPQVVAMSSAEVDPQKGVLTKWDHHYRNLAVDMTSIWSQVEDLIKPDVRSYFAMKGAGPTNPSIRIPIPAEKKPTN